MLPNFMIVGAPKAGTTSLYHYLDQNPGVFMCSPKEVNFFTAEEISSQRLFYQDYKCQNLDEYKALFEPGRGKIAVGEASVSYLFYPGSAGKIFSLTPDAKIIMVLRNPIDRGFSHYLMDHKLGLVAESYEAIVRRTCSHPYKDLYFQQYVELGLYYKQVRRYLEVFPREQVKIYTHEQLQTDIAGVMDDLCMFLGVKNAASAEIDKRHNVYSAPKNKLIHSFYSNPQLRRFLSRVLSYDVREKIKRSLFSTANRPILSDEIRVFLKNFYYEDVVKLDSILEQDIKGWIL